MTRVWRWLTTPVTPQRLFNLASLLSLVVCIPLARFAMRVQLMENEFGPPGFREPFEPFGPPHGFHQPSTFWWPVMFFTALPLIWLADRLYALGRKTFS